MIMTIAEREDGVDLEVVIENVQMIIQDRDDDPEVDHHDVDKCTNHALRSMCSPLNSSIQMDFSCIPVLPFPAFEINKFEIFEIVKKYFQ